MQGLYAIIDPQQIPGGRDVADITRAVIAGGATVVQLRDTISTARQMVERAAELLAICRDAGVPFIVNNRLDVALAVGADGVHLGPTDLPVEAARRVAPEGFIVGGSAGSAEVAQKLVSEGADYLGVGAVFEARPSKPDASAPRGLDVIRSVCAVVDVPVFGIGGITAENAAQVVAAGAQGVAVIRALMQADEPEKAARRLVEKLGR